MPNIILPESLNVKLFRKFKIYSSQCQNWGAFAVWNSRKNVFFGKMKVFEKNDKNSDYMDGR